MLQPGVGTNRYAYSMGDPVNKMDPGGNEPITISVALGWAIAATVGFLAADMAIDALDDNEVNGSLGPGVNAAMRDATVSVIGSVAPMAGIGHNSEQSSATDIEGIFGPGVDTTNKGANEPNIERQPTYDEALAGILGLPGATPTNTIDSDWGEIKVIELPDGTKVVARPGSKSGAPTIDVTKPDGTIEKNRFPNENTPSSEETDEGKGTKRDE